MSASDDCPNYACCLGRSKDEDDAEPRRPGMGLRSEDGPEAQLSLDFEILTTARTTGPQRPPTYGPVEARGSQPRSSFLLPMRPPVQAPTLVPSSARTFVMELEEPHHLSSQGVLGQARTGELQRPSQPLSLNSSSQHKFGTSEPLNSSSQHKFGTSEPLNSSSQRGLGGSEPLNSPPHQILEEAWLAQSTSQGAQGWEESGNVPDSSSQIHLAGDGNSNDSSNSDSSNNNNNNYEESASDVRVPAAPFTPLTPLVAAAAKLLGLGRQEEEEELERQRRRQRLKQQQQQLDEQQLQFQEEQFQEEQLEEEQLQEQPLEDHEFEEHRQHPTPATAPRSRVPGSAAAPRGSMTAPHHVSRGGPRQDGTAIERPGSYPGPSSAPPTARVLGVGGSSLSNRGPLLEAAGSSSALFRDLPLPLHTGANAARGRTLGSDTSYNRRKQPSRLGTPASDFGSSSRRGYELVPDTPGSARFAQGRAGQRPAAATPGSQDSHRLFGTRASHSSTSLGSSRRDENDSGTANCKDLDSISVCTTTKSWAPYTPGTGAFGSTSSPGLRDLSQPSTGLPQPALSGNLSGRQRRQPPQGSTVAMLTPISVDTLAPDSVGHQDLQGMKPTTDWAVEMCTPESVLTEAFFGQQNSKNPDREDALDETMSVGSHATPARGRISRPSLVTRLFG